MSAIPPTPPYSGVYRSELTYPGISAIFRHKEGDWSVYDSGADLCRRIDFESETAGSFISSFSLLGYWKGNVAIWIKFKEDVSFDQYLSAHQLHPDSSNDWFITDIPKELKTVFGILSRNNTIPASHFSLIQNIVEQGKTEPVPRPRQDFHIFN